MWNIPLLKLQSGSKPRMFRTHRRHWGMLEYSMDTCHLKKRERTLNSRICSLPFKHPCHHHHPALHVQSTCMFPAKIFIEPLLYAYMLGPGSSRQALASLTTQIRTVKSGGWSKVTVTDWALDFPSPHRHFLAPSLLYFSLAMITFPHIIYFTFLSGLFSACRIRMLRPHPQGFYLFCILSA